MSELRLNAATGDWVLVASERGDRPHAYREHAERPPAPDYEKSCPFCPGNRDETPHFQIALPESGFVRVLPNKFPAVSAGLVPKPNASLFERHMPAGGCHDVVVDNPRHNFRLAEGSEPELHAVVHAWRDRYRQLASDPHTRHVVIFKNYGAGAGSSLPHPHSQIVSLPVLPSQVRQRVETAMNVSNTLGRWVAASFAVCWSTKERRRRESWRRTGHSPPSCPTRRSHRSRSGYSLIDTAATLLT